MYNIILASASPRRKELLEQIGVKLTVSPSNCDEKIEDTAPDKVVQSLSLQKAADVADNQGENTITIGSDTIVAVNDEILGKPKDREDAFNMLKKLSGKVHQVYTGVTLIIKNDDLDNFIIKTFYSKTDVKMKNLSEKEIEWYLNTDEPYDKAGAYAIQGLSAIFIEEISGDYNTVVGLPVAKIYCELEKMGIDIVTQGE